MLTSTAVQLLIKSKINPWKSLLFFFFWACPCCGTISGKLLCFSATRSGDTLYFFILSY